MPAVRYEKFYKLLTNLIENEEQKGNPREVPLSHLANALRCSVDIAHQTRAETHPYYGPIQWPGWEEQVRRMAGESWQKWRTTQRFEVVMPIGYNSEVVRLLPDKTKKTKSLCS